jgi:hypothetical protein
MLIVFRIRKIEYEMYCAACNNSWKFHLTNKTCNCIFRRQLATIICRSLSN